VQQVVAGASDACGEVVARAPKEAGELPIAAGEARKNASLVPLSDSIPGSGNCFGKSAEAV